MYFLFKNNRTHNPQHEFKVIAKQTTAPKKKKKKERNMTGF